MSIKIINNLDIIVYVGIGDEEKLPIFNKEFLELNKEEKEYFLRVSEIYEDFQDKVFRFHTPCVLKIEGNLDVIMERRGENVKLEEEKKKVEKPKTSKDEESGKKSEEKLKEIKQTKVLKYHFESLKKGNFVFINNDRSKYYKIKKIIKSDKKIEFVLSDVSLVEENLLTIDPFKSEISNFANFKYRIVFFDNRIMERSIKIDINSPLNSVQDFISNQIKSFIKTPDYRFVYKGEDVTYNGVNKKIFILKCEKKDKEEEKKVSKKKIIRQNTPDLDSDEPPNLNMLFGGPEDEENKPSKVEESNSESESEDENEKNKNEKNFDNLPMSERFEKCKNLCELKFDFMKDYFSILIPDTQFKLCNLFQLGSYDYTSGWRNVNYVNLFIFSADLKIKNFSICGPSDGSKFDKIDFLIYESNYKKQKYLNDKDSSSAVNRYEVGELLEADYWKKQKVIYNQDNIVLKKNFESEIDIPLEKITNRAYIINTELMEFSKDKIYAFVFKLKENPNGDYLYYFSKSDSRFQSNINGDFEILSYTNKSTYFFLYGFEYKFKL